jgi:CheY-like chemotaxis protein
MLNNPRILVVDDDFLNTTTLVDIFSVNNYHAEAAANGQEALDKFKTGSYDCVLSDIRMPNMNGVELLREVKRIKPDILFILMTAYADDDLIMEGIKTGALVTMDKPLDMDGLLYQLKLSLNL